MLPGSRLARDLPGDSACHPKPLDGETITGLYSLQEDEPKVIEALQVYVMKDLMHCSGISRRGCGDGH